jgi:uncharacterized repeat protein (TIGR01451 family)
VPANGPITNKVSSTATTSDPDASNNNGTAAAAVVISTVSPSADVRTTKTGATNVTAGASLVYTITVTNLGPSSTTNLVVSDLIPTNSTFVSASSGGTYNAGSGTVTWTPLTNFTANATTNFTVTVTAPANGSMTNKVSSTATTSDPDASNNNGTAAAAIVISTVSPSADVRTTKTGSTNVTAGASLVYTITVTNLGPSSTTNLVVTDLIPTNSTFVSASSGGTYDAGSGTVTWTPLTNFTANATTNFTVTVTVPANGPITNKVSSTATTSDPDASNNNGTAAAAIVISTVSPSADVRTTKTGSTNVTAGASLVYTITVTNLGPSSTTNLVVSDLIPTNSTFVSASSGGTYNASSGTVTWTPLTNFTANATTNFTVTITAPANGSMTNKVSSTATTSDPDASNNDGAAAEAMVITTVTPVSPSGVNVSGYVYLDANENGFKDGSEAGTGLSLFAKIVATTNLAGPALQAATVNSSSGAYTFTNIGTNTWCILVDDNATLSDVTPTIPSGWSGIEMPAYKRTNVAVAAAAVTEQNFGLVNAVTLAGRVFQDTGTGGGTANDGVPNGGETDLAGVTVKLTDNTGATTHDTATTDGSGNFTLRIPSAIAGGTVLKVVETNPGGHLSTGGEAGTTGGSYDRASDTVTFTVAAGTSYTGVNFGDVPENSFQPDNRQSNLPGTFVLHAHTFLAGSAGSLTFTVAGTPAPAIPGWSQVLYRDANCNGQLDPGEALISGAIVVSAGDKVCLFVKDFIPVGAALGAQNAISVTASLVYSGASPALTNTATRSDVTVIGPPTTTGLTLVKTVDKDSALPGETLTYTVTYANLGAETLRDVVVHDATPVFTTFASAGNGALPSNLTGVSITQPSVGGTGAIRWTFTGTLAPGSSGTVTYTVTVGQ